eukprot:4822275-Pleurochrysis_carterae.AAC.1
MSRMSSCAKTPQELHLESITYVNICSTHSADHTTLRIANAAAADISILITGNIVCVLPNEDYLNNKGAAFWLGR